MRYYGVRYNSRKGAKEASEVFDQFDLLLTERPFQRQIIPTLKFNNV